MQHNTRPTLLNVKRKRFWCNCGTGFRCQYWKWSHMQDNVCSDVSDEGVASSWNKFTPAMEAAGPSETPEHTTLNATRPSELHPSWQHDNVPNYFINQTNERKTTVLVQWTPQLAFLHTHANTAVWLFGLPEAKPCAWRLATTLLATAQCHPQGWNIQHFLHNGGTTELHLFSAKVLKRIDFLTKWKVTLVTWHQKEAQHSQQQNRRIVAVTETQRAALQTETTLRT